MTADVLWVPESSNKIPVLLARDRLEATGGQSPRDEFAQQRNLALLQQRDGPGRIRRHARLGGIPIHQRQVVVAGVFFVAHELFQEFPALTGSHSLQGRSEVEPDDRGFFCATELANLINNRWLSA